MRCAFACDTTTHAAPEIPEVEFGRSTEGIPVARVADTGFGMLPAHDGRHYLATGWKIARPIGEWRHTDFLGNAGELADEAAFRSRVLEHAEHQREKRALGRKDIHGRAQTPWGISQGAIVYAEGVESHSTAGHGGLKLSAERNREVHSLLRAKGGWYEEDCAWAIVAITFPELFTRFERRCAERSVKDSWPDAWETISGSILRPVNPMRRTGGLFTRRMPATGSWSRRSIRLRERVSSNVSPRQAASAGPEPRSAAFSFQPTSMPSVGLASSSIHPVMLSTPGLPASLVGSEESRRDGPA